MSPQQRAAAEVMREYGGKPYERGTMDCGIMTARYIECVTGRVIDFEDKGRPTKKHVSTYLGEPVPDLEYGDVVLSSTGGMGINLGYCILTVMEDEGMVRILPEGFKIKHRWRIA